MNAVVKEYPDNAVDILGSSVRYEQVLNIWKLASAGGGAPIINLMRGIAGKTVEHIEGLIHRAPSLIPWQFDRHYPGVSLEKVFETTLSMVQSLAREDFDALLSISFKVWAEGWHANPMQIGNAVELTERIWAVKRLPRPVAAQMIDDIRREALRLAVIRCSSHELRQIVDSIQFRERCDPLILLATDAFHSFRSNEFQEELRECHATWNLEELRENLECFRKVLGVEIAGLLRVIGDEAPEVEQEESAERDDWDERWELQNSDSRHENLRLRQMFDSLGRFD